MDVNEFVETELDGNPMGAIHLLLIGHTKFGKSDYAVQAARDGFEVIYVDADNGLDTILKATAGETETRSRIHYFNPVDIADFLDALLTTPELRYNVRTRRASTELARPDDRMIIIRPMLIPRQIILVVDSWTSVSYAIMKKKATDAKEDLSNIEKISREVYAGAGFRATNMLTAIQAALFHVIVIGHPDFYERKEKPDNVSVKEGSKEVNMIIRETLEIPLSVSKPHGSSIGKYFNQIGWMIVDRANNRKLDFRVIEGRLGGGSAGNLGDPRVEYRFSKLFGEARPTSVNEEEPWLSTKTYQEILDEIQNRTMNALRKAKATPAAQPVTIPAKPLSFAEKLAASKAAAAAAAAETQPETKETDNEAAQVNQTES